MRNTIAEGKLDVRTKLITIILFICFEIYHGNNASVIDQIRAGSILIENQCREWITDNGTSKPPPSIDDELLESFTELELQAVIQSGHNMTCERLQHVSCRLDILASLTSEFTTLRQARGESSGSKRFPTAGSFGACLQHLPNQAITDSRAFCSGAPPYTHAANPLDCTTGQGSKRGVYASNYCW